MKYTAILLLLITTGATAQTVGIAVPQSNNSNFNYDEIRTSSGATCRQAMGSNTVIEFGAVGSEAGSDGTYFEHERNFNNVSDGNAIYGRITYFLGAPKRLDCSHLYDLEIQQLKRQIQMLQGDVIFDEVVPPKSVGYVEVLE